MHRFHTVSTHSALSPQTQLEFCITLSLHDTRALVVQLCVRVCVIHFRSISVVKKRVFEDAKQKHYGHMDRRTDGLMDGPTDEQADGPTDRPMDGQMDRPFYRDARTHLETFE